MLTYHRSDNYLPEEAYSKNNALPGEGTVRQIKTVKGLPRKKKLTVLGQRP